jgi:hypothetical protein
MDNMFSGAGYLFEQMKIDFFFCTHDLMHIIKGGGLLIMHAYLPGQHIINK